MPLPARQEMIVRQQAFDMKSTTEWINEFTAGKSSGSSLTANQIAQIQRDALLMVKQVLMGDDDALPPEEEADKDQTEPDGKAKLKRQLEITVGVPLPAKAGQMVWDQVCFMAFNLGELQLE